MYLHFSLPKTVSFLSYFNSSRPLLYIYIIHEKLSIVCIAKTTTTKTKNNTNNITNNNNKEKTTNKMYIKRSNHRTS